MSQSNERQQARDLMHEIETLFQAGDLDAVNERFFQKVPESPRLIIATLRCAFRAKEHIKDYRKFMYNAYIWLHKNDDPKAMLIGMPVSQGKVLCSKCDKTATWWYAPYSPSKIQINAFYCEDHISRGCSCQEALKPGVSEKYDEYGNIDNSSEDYEYYTDSLGRALPCIEYDYSEDGFDIMEYLDYEEGKYYAMQGDENVQGD